MGDDPILAETRAEVSAVLGPDLAGATIARAVVDLCFTGVELDIGTAGVCATPPRAKLYDACCPATRFAVLQSGTLRGRRVPDPLFRHGGDLVGGVRRTDPASFLDVLAEGGSDREFFGSSAEPVVLVPNQVPERMSYDTA